MYQITIYQSGKLIKTTDPIAAPNALVAIAQVEKGYTAQEMSLEGKRVRWTGLEFQARKVN